MLAIPERFEIEIENPLTLQKYNTKIWWYKIV